MQAGGWIVHSLQQDGVLVERGFRPDRTPALPLASLTLSVRQAMFDEHGLHLRMIEKTFHAPRDDPVYAEIIAALALPLSSDTVPARPPPPQVSGRLPRPTTQEVFRSASSGAMAAARRVATLEASAEEMAARAGDALLEARAARVV